MKIKLGISLFLAFFAFLFIAQNTEIVQVNLLFWSAEMSLVLLLFILLGVGMSIGWLLASYLRFARNRTSATSEADSTATHGEHKTP